MFSCSATILSPLISAALSAFSRTLSLSPTGNNPCLSFEFPFGKHKCYFNSSQPSDLYLVTYTSLTATLRRLKLIFNVLSNMCNVALCAREDSKSAFLKVKAVHLREGLMLPSSGPKVEPIFLLCGDA